LRQALSDRPGLEKLERTLGRLLTEKAEAPEFIVLFGSMARGDWSRDSDYDLLVGLRLDDGQRVIDRMAEFAELAEGPIEVFPYARSEWQRMFEDRHLLVLEALEHGVILWDRGSFAQMRVRFREWRERGWVVPWRSGWKIVDLPEAEPARASSWARPG
jgi:predicted nucleotidyltransferase